MRPRPFFSTCVSWPCDLHAAKDFLDSEGVEVGRSDFLALVSAGHMRALEKALGYGGRGGIRMSEDWHVRYFREPRTGIPFFVHSAIEHVFAYPGEIETLDARCRAEQECGGARQVTLLAFPEHLVGRAPPEGSAENDAFDHQVFGLIDGDADVILIEGPGRADMSENDRRLLDRMTEILEAQGRLAAHLRDQAPEPPPEDLVGPDLRSRITERIMPEAIPAPEP